MCLSRVAADFRLEASKVKTETVIAAAVVLALAVRARFVITGLVVSLAVKPSRFC